MKRIPRRGLTYRDISLGSYGVERCPKRSAAIAPMLLAVRRFPPVLPDAQPWVSRKSEVWAHQHRGYYEEAVSRQWNVDD